MTSVLGLTSEQWHDHAKATLTSGAGVAAVLYQRAFREGILDFADLGLTEASQLGWRENYAVDLLTVAQVVDEPGELGITSKALLTTADGLFLECVRIPMPPQGDRARATLCLSSQVGCRMGCAFCETGKAGLVRNLTAVEIVSQVLTTRLKLGWDCGNLVFMGMGEPLDNFDNVAQALKVLGDRRGFAYAAERITICTSGPPGGISRLKDLGMPRLGVSISLNGGSDRTRGSIMPITRAHNLEALTAELADYSQRKNFVLGANYCLIPGLNDTQEEAHLVGEFCRRVGRVLVNVIPYNPGSEPLGRTPTEAELERFEGWLKQEGCPLRRRATKGASIMAACGQLGGTGPGVGPVNPNGFPHDP